MIKGCRKVLIFETEGKKSNSKRPSQIYNFRNTRKKYKSQGNWPCKSMVDGEAYGINADNQDNLDSCIKEVKILE